MSEELASLDGVVAPSGDTSVPVTDEGFLRGDGAFEVVRVYGGVPFLLDEHLDRMERSAANLRLEGGLQRADFEREAPELLERSAIRRASTAACGWCRPAAATGC